MNKEFYKGKKAIWFTEEEIEVLEDVLSVRKYEVESATDKKFFGKLINRCTVALKKFEIDKTLGE